MAVGDEAPVGRLGTLDQLALSLPLFRAGLDHPTAVARGAAGFARIEFGAADLRPHQRGTREGIVLSISRMEIDFSAEEDAFV